MATPYVPAILFLKLLHIVHKGSPTYEFPKFEFNEVMLLYRKDLYPSSGPRPAGGGGNTAQPAESMKEKKPLVADSRIGYYTRI